MDNEEFQQKLDVLDRLQSACTHCGLCSESCATFQSTGWEQESPRGRIRLARDFLNGKIQPHSTALETFDRCLGCQACERSCPLSVSYQRIHHAVQDLRRNLQSKSSSLQNRRLYWGWIKLAYRMGSAWWRTYGLRILALSHPLLSLSKGRFIAAPTCQGRERFLSLAFCCLQDILNHALLEESVLFLGRLGYEARLDPKQPCCGAIFERLVEGGQETVEGVSERKRALNYQKKRIQAFKKWYVQPTYFLSKGCQCFSASYLEVKEEESDLYAWILQALAHQKGKLFFSQPKVVYYQPYCSQSKKEERDLIWQLLKQIEGLTVRWLSMPLACCGGCKGETLLNPPQAQLLASTKLQDLPEGATLIVTSPDCWGQFQSQALACSYEVLYPIQLLYRAQLTFL